MLTCAQCKVEFLENWGGCKRGELFFCTGFCLMDYFHPPKPKKENVKKEKE